MKPSDRFFIAYVEAALWSSNDESDEFGGHPMDANYSADDIDAGTLATMRAHCERFQAENTALLLRFSEQLPTQQWTAEEQAGHDFWLSRNGHGAGFFDRDVSDDVKDALQASAEGFGEYDLYVGDDGRIYGYEG